MSELLSFDPEMPPHGYQRLPTEDETSPLLPPWAINTASSDISSAVVDGHDEKGQSEEAYEMDENPVDEKAVHDRLLSGPRPTPVRALIFIALLLCMASAAVTFSIVEGGDSADHGNGTATTEAAAWELAYDDDDLPAATFSTLPPHALSEQQRSGRTHGERDHTREMRSLPANRGEREPLNSLNVDIGRRKRRRRRRERRKRALRQSRSHSQTEQKDDAAALRAVEDDAVLHQET